jgi:hypothetical protein
MCMHMSIQQPNCSHYITAKCRSIHSELWHQFHSNLFNPMTRQYRRGGGGGGGGGAGRRREKAPAKAAAGGRTHHTHEVRYTGNESVLIAGDGDFSFSKAVVIQRGSATGVVCTSLDSEEEVKEKYGQSAIRALSFLKQKGAKVVHGVDVKDLSSNLGRTPGDKRQRHFSRVIFNFPHTGAQRVHLNRNLLQTFFRSSLKTVLPAVKGGEVHMTLSCRPPYCNWDVRRIAAAEGLVLIRELAFNPSSFPGYRHRTTLSNAKQLDTSRCVTYCFGRAENAEDTEDQPPSADEASSTKNDAAAQREEAGRGPFYSMDIVPVYTCSRFSALHKRLWSRPLVSKGWMPLDDFIAYLRRREMRLLGLVAHGDPHCGSCACHGHEGE